LFGKIYKLIKSQDNYFWIFMLFSFFTIVFILSPVIIKEPCAKDFIRKFLADLYSYKQTYLQIIGAILGTGLAVSSAVLLQRNSAREKEIEDKQTEIFKQRQAAKVIENWVRSEITMLWGMWVWATFNISLNNINGVDLPFEPYCVDNNKVYDYYLSIDHKISNTSRNIFYKFYRFSEKTNQYIENYNRMNYDIMLIESNNYGATINISSDVRKNSSFDKYKEILRYLIDTNKLFLFFDEDIEIISLDKFFKKRRLLQIELDELHENMIKKYQTEKGGIEYFKATFEINKYLEKKVDIPEEYKLLQTKYDDILQQIKELEQSYEGTKRRFYDEIENPVVNSKIKDLIEELNTILDTYNT